MRTKIVYVLTSSNKDYYFEQTLLSIYSLKLHNPTAKVTIVTDKDTEKSFVGNRKKIYELADEIISPSIPDEFNNLQKSRYLKTQLREIVSGDFLYVDTDTIISDSLEEIDELKCDLGAVIDKHINIKRHSGKLEIYKYAKLFNWNIPDNDLYFNGGLMFAKDSEIAHKFYQTWHKFWIDGVKNKGINIDQPTLALANDFNGYPIVELDGTFNCQVIENGLKYLANAKIIHYYASNVGKWDCPYLFRNDNVYKRVRENGIDSEIHSMIENAKSAFTDKSLILGGNACDAFSTTLNGVARRCVYKFPRLSKVVDKIYLKFFK